MLWWIWVACGDFCPRCSYFESFTFQLPTLASRLVIAAVHNLFPCCAISLPTAPMLATSCSIGSRNLAIGQSNSSNARRRPPGSTAAAPLGGRTETGLAQSQPPPGKGLRGIDRQCYRLDLHCFYATPRPAACLDTTITILSRTLWRQPEAALQCRGLRRSAGFALRRQQTQR
jgi:hypothetical protein